MTKITQIIFLLFICFSCTKKVGEAPSAEGPTEVYADSIVYKDIQPDIILNSVSSKSLHGSGWFYVNLPVDTSCSVALNQNDFSEFTFKLYAGNYFEQRSYSSPESNYLHYMSIVPLVALDSFLAIGSFPCIKLFKNGDTIRHTSMNTNISSIIRMNTSSSNCYCSVGEYFLGFKKTRGSLVNFGWIKIERFGVNGIKVKEIAINRTNGKAIVCGQTQ